MMIKVNDLECELLVRLLEASRGETSVEIHHAMDYKTHDSLREERKPPR